MSKIHNININANIGATERLENGKKDSMKPGSHTVNASNLNLGTDFVNEKRNQAREKANKVISDAFSNETVKDDEFKMRRANIEDMKKESTEAKRIVNDVNDKLAGFKEEYGVDDNSQEQKDLELLEKRVESQRDNSHIKLTKDEKARLEEIDAKGLTEYQERSIRVYELGSVYNEKATELDRKIDAEVKGLQAAKLDRLKEHPMVDAAKEADKINESANNEVISSLIEEAKDKIDEKTDEEKKKADEEKEAEEKLEELINRGRDDDKKDDITDEMPLDELQDDVSLKMQLDKIVKDSGLSQEDIVGLSINKEV